ncbi:hypothetical protein [Alkalimarinus alittae]|uniref:PH domain-containing protein n=1 Tax=Alkalimarinus alittae TaxID=2961619 RepID=A0ABY6MYG0_9ALTE|nr:hypothetical protein [Alkalimarinus alittae]UZE94817.1 hypothetical protein NKI27_12085 [Alkalimarinus alittae]
MIFYYAKTQTRQAITLAVNILLIPVLLYAFRYFLHSEPNFEQLYAVVKIGAFVVAAVMVVILLWLLKKNDRFEIYVTDSEFYSHHPVFKEWCFSVNPKDIVAIEHNLEVSQSAMTNINVCLKNGERVQITQNYNFSRKDLYDALKQANPDIKLPENANLFNHKLNR